MSPRTKGTEDETPLSPAEMQALHRLAEPQPAQAEAQPNELWASRYLIKEKIGKGGMGDVYLAHDVVLDRHIALKVLRKTSDESFVDEARLLREARAAARVEHERLARIYDALTWNDQALIAMEYVRGETLRDWMKSHRPTMSEVVAILQQLLEGLQVLHQNGLVHRDLKPENVMVTADGNLRILDLGIARRVALADTVPGTGDEASLFTLGFGVGTPGYMAPEQWRQGETDARADLFALGVIAYELVLGRQPFFGGTNLEIREQTLNKPLAFNGNEWKEVPVPVKTTIQTALARDPAERFQNVSEMAKTLMPLFRPTLPPISGPHSHPIRPPGDDKTRRESLSASVVGVSRPPSSRRRRFMFLSGGLLIASALALTMLRSQSRRRADPPTLGMVRLAGGSFAMGTDRAELEAMCATYPRGCPPEAYQETPSRPVSVAPFELDEREITNEEFARFLQSIGPSIRVVFDGEEGYDRFVYYKLRPTDDPLLLYDLWHEDSGIALTPPSSFQSRAGLDKHPVTLVTWLGARLYCRSINKRLPTEAEWELAARGLEKRPFPWGSQPPNCGVLHLWAGSRLNVQNPNLCDHTGKMATPIMSASQDVTPEGVFDMGLGVTEWVDEKAQVNDDEATYLGRLSLESPAVHRGGAYNAAFMARSTSRNYRLAFNVAPNLGFRCAKSIASAP